MRKLLFISLILFTSFSQAMKLSAPLASGKRVIEDELSEAYEVLKDPNKIYKTSFTESDLRTLWVAFSDDKNRSEIGLSIFPNEESNWSNSLSHLNINYPYTALSLGNEFFVYLNLARSLKNSKFGAEFYPVIIRRLAEASLYLAATLGRDTRFTLAGQTGLTEGQQKIAFAELTKVALEDQTEISTAILSDVNQLLQSPAFINDLRSRVTSSSRRNLAKAAVFKTFIQIFTLGRARLLNGLVDDAYAQDQNLKRILDLQTESKCVRYLLGNQKTHNSEP